MNARALAHDGNCERVIDCGERIAAIEAKVENVERAQCFAANKIEEIEKNATTNSIEIARINVKIAVFSFLGSTAAGIAASLITKLF